MSNDHPITNAASLILYVVGVCMSQQTTNLRQSIFHPYYAIDLRTILLGYLIVIANSNAIVVLLLYPTFLLGH